LVLAPPLRSARVAPRRPGRTAAAHRPFSLPPSLLLAAAGEPPARKSARAQGRRRRGLLARAAPPDHPHPAPPPADPRPPDPAAGCEGDGGAASLAGSTRRRFLTGPAPPEAPCAAAPPDPALPRPDPSLPRPDPSPPKAGLPATEPCAPGTLRRVPSPRPPPAPPPGEFELPPTRTAMESGVGAPSACSEGPVPLSTAGSAPGPPPVLLPPPSPLRNQARPAPGCFGSPATGSGVSTPGSGSAWGAGPSLPLPHVLRHTAGLHRVTGGLVPRRRPTPPTSAVVCSTEAAALLRTALRRPSMVWFSI